MRRSPAHSAQPRADQPGAPKGPPGSDRGERKEARTGVAAIFAVIAAVVGFLTVGALEDRATGAALLGAVGGLAAAVITVQLAQYLAFQFAGRLLTVTAVALAALAAGLGGAAFRVVSSLTDPALTQVKACLTDDGRPRKGLLVGQTSDAVFVGDTEQDLVVQIPTARIAQLFIGESRGRQSCPPVKRPT